MLSTAWMTAVPVVAEVEMVELAKLRRETANFSEKSESMAHLDDAEGGVVGEANCVAATVVGNHWTRAKRTALSKGSREVLAKSCYCCCSPYSSQMAPGPGGKSSLNWWANCSSHCLHQSSPEQRLYRQSEE